LVARVYARREGDGPVDGEAVRLQARLMRKASTAPAPMGGA
jgi:hypothetical protein